MSSDLQSNNGQELNLKKIALYSTIGIGVLWAIGTIFPGFDIKPRDPNKFDYSKMTGATYDGDTIVDFDNDGLADLITSKKDSRFRVNFIAPDMVEKVKPDYQIHDNTPRMTPDIRAYATKTMLNQRGLQKSIDEVKMEAYKARQQKRK